ncbi:MAG: cytochrome c family protein [Coriobacteriia bacterium]|nr:cytochrome c family protein [Coriobacteriia bacterium]
MKPIAARHTALLVVLLAFILWTSPAVAVALPSMPSSLFETSEGCGCHAALMDQWRGSMHQQALTDPIYLYELGLGEEATNGALGTFCNACHSPIAIMAGELTSLDQSKVSPQGMEGVTCDFCHQMSGTETPIGNTSMSVTGDGVKLAQLKDPQATHPAAYSAFHETAEFCGSCHDVYHPFNGLLLEATYTEWKNGPYAAEGIVCQDCHMTPGPGVRKPNPGKAAAMGPEREHIYTMTFAGGNVGLGDADLAEERLKAAAELTLDMPEIAEGGDVQLTTTITNVGAGHYLPTGLTEVRLMWLEVTAVDQAGNELLREKREFHSVLEGADGTYPVYLWDAVKFHSDDRIPPKESVSNEYTFPMAEGAVTVKAALYYRSCSEEIAKKSGVEIPTTTMAEVTQVVYSSSEAQEAGQAEEEPSETDDGTSFPWGLAIALAVVVAGAIAVLAWRKARTTSA